MFVWRINDFVQLCSWHNAGALAQSELSDYILLLYSYVHLPFRTSINNSYFNNKHNIYNNINNNKCIGDDTKVAARQSPNCIYKTK